MPPESKRKRSSSVPVYASLSYEPITCGKSTQTCDADDQMHTSDGLSTFSFFPKFSVEIQVMILNIAADPDSPKPRPKWWPSPCPGGYNGKGYGNSVLKDEVVRSPTTKVPSLVQGASGEENEARYREY